MYHKMRKYSRAGFDFDSVNRAARPVLHAICQRLLPGGKVMNSEYVVRNPLRADRSPGSFKINLRSGRWADFACDARGGDVVSLVAYIERVNQGKAARLLAQMLDMGGAND